jgi:pimeloyl-ACP methyl ester carboxylesterase
MRVDIGGGVRLFFDVAGSSLEPDDDELRARPTLLVLHGGPGADHSAFRPYFDRFADTHLVVYLDHRGNGRSDQRHDPSGWNLDTWADDVVRFCDALEIERPVVLGNSFGGFVAMHYGARHPDHPSKLVLMSTQARRFADDTAARFEALGGPEARETYEAMFVRHESSPELTARYFELNLPLYNRRPTPFGPRRAWQNLRVLGEFNNGFSALDLRADLPQIACPTLVLCGEDDPMTPPAASRELLELLPDGLGELEVFADCGHGTYRDQPDLTEASLRAFFAS